MHALINLLMEEKARVCGSIWSVCHPTSYCKRASTYFVDVCIYILFNLLNGQHYEKKLFASSPFDSAVHYIEIIIIDRDYVNAKDQKIKLCHFKRNIASFKYSMSCYWIFPYMSLAYIYQFPIYCRSPYRTLWKYRLLSLI